MIRGMKQLPYETEKTWTAVCRGEGGKKGNMAEVCNIVEVVSKNSPNPTVLELCALDGSRRRAVLSR